MDRLHGMMLRCGAGTRGLEGRIGHTFRSAGTADSPALAADAAAGDPLSSCCLLSGLLGWPRLRSGRSTAGSGCLDAG